MFALEALPAGHGDALVVEYGKGTARHRVLVDAGTVGTWEHVRDRLLRRADDHYEVFVVTHVDEDHIGGAISLLDDPDLRHRVSHVWFNGYVHCHKGGTILGPVHGEQLTSRIVDRGLSWNEGFPDSPTAGTGGAVGIPTASTLRELALDGGARAVFLSPDRAALKKMATVWEKDVVAAKLVPGAGAEGHRGGGPVNQKRVAPLPDVLDEAALRNMADVDEHDTSKANRSSIAFVLEYGKKRLLLAADAHPDVLAAGLRRYGERVGEERPRIDLVKLAHHGSGANLTVELLEAMDATRFVISSNGDKFGHPDDSAIARAILHAPGPVTFYCNYASPRTTPWAARAAEVGAVVKVPKRTGSGCRVTV